MSCPWIPASCLARPPQPPLSVLLRMDCCLLGVVFPGGDRSAIQGWLLLRCRAAPAESSSLPRMLCAVQAVGPAGGAVGRRRRWGAQGRRGAAPAPVLLPRPPQPAQLCGAVGHAGRLHCLRLRGQSRCAHVCSCGWVGAWVREGLGMQFRMPCKGGLCLSVLQLALGGMRGHAGFLEFARQ
jgi:hypothetical protein